MASLNKFEDSAAAFLQKFPVGAVVHGEEIVTWAQSHGNGLSTDLLIGDPGKMLSALRRHLNSGASSRSFSEADRYYIDVTDAKRKTFVIRNLAEHTYLKAEAAFDKSVTGALTPLTQTSEGHR